MKLTSTNVRSLQPHEHNKQYFVWDAETRGFGVRVTSGGTRNYIAQSRVNGRVRRVTLGRCDLLSCDDARWKAKSKLLQMYEGIDPLTEDRSCKARNETLVEVMHDYFENRRTGNGALRPRSKKNIEQSVLGVFSEWANKPIADINRDACLEKFRKHSTSAPAQTNQAFRNLRALINWSREKYVDGQGQYTIFITNPVSQMFKGRKLAQWNRVAPRTSRIPINRIALVWSILQQLACLERNRRSTAISADLCMFLLLAGTRSGEAKNLRWQDLDLSSSVATFHLAVTKNHRAVTLPVSDALRAVFERRLADRMKGNEFVFPSQRKANAPMGDGRAVLAKVSDIAEVHIHPHALRRTFDDVAQACGISGDERRKLLNHCAEDVHGLAYSNNPDPHALLSAANLIGNWYLSAKSVHIEGFNGQNRKKT